MAMMVMNTANGSRFGHLSQDLLRTIFEFDDTYKKLFQQQVLLDIWQTSWKRWHSNVLCPYKFLVMEWLLNNWGVYDSCIDESFWFSRYYHVNDVTVQTQFVRIADQESSESSDMDENLLDTENSEDIVGEEEKYKCIIRVYMKQRNMTVRVFDGEIMTGKQYTVDCQKDTEIQLQTIDVHWNRETGLVLYHRFYQQ